MFLVSNSPHPDHIGTTQAQRHSSLGPSHVCSPRSGQRWSEFTFSDAMSPLKPFNGEGLLSGDPRGGEIPLPELPQREENVSLAPDPSEGGKGIINLLGNEGLRLRVRSDAFQLSRQRGFKPHILFKTLIIMLS